MFMRHPNTSRPPIILASASPRRRQLLVEAGYDFTITPPESAESGANQNESPEAMVARLAWEKALDVVARVETGIVLGCDTVAECRGGILGKPSGMEDARRMLGLLQGSQHRVLSGLCLWEAGTQRYAVEVAVTRLFMEPLSAQRIEGYLASGQWRGKAGAFGYQDGHDWLRILEGSESNVVGLPLELLEQMLGNMTGEKVRGKMSARKESPPRRDRNNTI
uniref:dTTP/UTP pyrophosphatase n=1 Tax=Candidatus Kentrum sp. MB TaxID=2138164 RepID=A0A450XEX7_9GAMM|nr:MAG: septum formation protein [Candidatus Kentron sp. MB]VFK31816.1 MAG: septum formation protein [Candidatus Kentron sp. MB]VFK75582.1 MAG: septum formation protein [Candidatus Kentron sp. MB]